MGTGELLGKPNKLRGLASRPGAVEILLAASMAFVLVFLNPPTNPRGFLPMVFV